MSRPRVQALVGGGGERLARLSSHGRGARGAARVVAAVLPRLFDPERARDLDATLELRVRDERDGSVKALTLRVDRGELTVTQGAASRAGAAAEVSAGDLIRLAAGSVGWPELIAGRRMTLSGDPFLALRFPSLFRLPAG